MVLSHVDGECSSLLKKYRQIVQEINYLVFYTGQDGFYKGGKYVQLLKISGWDQKVSQISDYDSCL